MKSLMYLMTALLDDLGSICSVETARDLDTLRSRAQHEGLSFFTITLPDFASDFERGLEQGRIDSTLFRGWKKRGCLPAFLQGFTSLVFGTSGEVRDAASTTAVFCVRQLCRACKKVRIDCSDERTGNTFRKYKELESSLPDDFYVDGARMRHFNDTSRIIWTEVFGSNEFHPLDLVPKHGPGATAEGISGNAKYQHLHWHERLEEFFPFGDYLFSSYNQFECEKHGVDAVTLLAEDQELPVRVIAVPKTLKGPRIIAIEPVCMQYVQQAVGRWVMSRIENSWLTRRSIRFTDQTVNQRMAISSSADGQYSTIDLSDASDRVHMGAVRAMLDSQPTLLEAVERCRSTKAKLPDGDIIPLKKFASMGSALCFPIESMFFYTVMVHSILWERKLAPKLHDIMKVSRRLNVYGDDLIVPVCETDIVMEGLTTFGCKVNASKSFRNGKFRESCGQDAYSGVDVTPIYVRELCPSTKRDSTGIVSWISTSNLFFKAGCWKTADLMKREVERLVGKLPTVCDGSPGLGWVGFTGIPDTYPMCINTHRPLVRTYKVQAKRVRDSLEGYPALLKWFLPKTTGSFVPVSVISKDHLRFSARNGSVSRKRHWVPAT